MINALKVIFTLTTWVFVPLILLLLIIVAHTVSGKMKDSHHKASTKAGFWAGFLLYVMALIFQAGPLIAAGMSDRALYQGFHPLLALATSALVFGLIPQGKKRPISPSVSGVIILVITFLAFYSLTHYLFIRTQNDILLSLILGITFGALAYLTCVPSLIHKLMD